MEILLKQLGRDQFSAAVTYEDMRTSPHYVFGIIGGNLGYMDTRYFRLVKYENTKTLIKEIQYSQTWQ